MRAAQAQQEARVNLRRKKPAMGVCAVLADLALTTAPRPMYALRANIDLFYTPAKFSTASARRSSCRRRASACARRRDGDARQRQARPGLAEGELQPLRRRRVGDGEL